MEQRLLGLSASFFLLCIQMRRQFSPAFTLFRGLGYAAKAFAVSKGLAVVHVDGVKTGEKIDRCAHPRRPGGKSGTFCGAEVLERSNCLYK
jgi:hypothetical protein